jgi:hypothetical protein
VPAFERSFGSFSAHPLLANVGNVLQGCADAPCQVLVVRHQPPISII